MLVYETDQSWIPDVTYINSPQGIEYLAWNIGLDARRVKSLWLIEPVRDPTTQDLVDLLPVGYTSYTFTDDVIKYGHLRSTLTQYSVIELQELFLTDVEETTAQVEAGFR